MYYFVVNRASGQVKRKWHRIAKILRERGVKFKAYLTNAPGHAAQLAERISLLPGKKRLIVVGGDGTINEVINGIADFATTSLGVIPLGSANDFVRGVELPDHEEEALEAILSCRQPVKMDLGRVNYPDGSSRLFGISAGVGLDAIICKKASESKIKFILNKIGLGGLTYLLIAVVTVLTMEREDVALDIDGEAVAIDRLIYLAAMNVRQEGGGVPMAPEADVFDGRLSLCCGFQVSKLTGFFYLLMLAKGRHMGNEKFYLRDFRKLTLFSHQPLTLHTDGEYGGCVTTVSIECLPGVLSLLKLN